MSRARSRFPGMSAGERIYSAVLHRDKRAEQELDPEVRRNLAPNGLRLVTANALQSSGDQIVNASTVLPWLFNALGVPVALTGLLVPIRESLSMLPQAFLTPLIVRVRFRKWVFISGALVQAASAGVIAGTAALGQGLVAGVVILVGLAAFALGRCLCSIASKDVQGRTIPKGELRTSSARGQHLSRRGRRRQVLRMVRECRRGGSSHSVARTAPDSARHWTPSAASTANLGSATPSPSMQDLGRCRESQLTPTCQRRRRDHAGAGCLRTTRAVRSSVVALAATRSYTASKGDSTSSS